MKQAMMQIMMVIAFDMPVLAGYLVWRRRRKVQLERAHRDMNRLYLEYCGRRQTMEFWQREVGR